MTRPDGNVHSKAVQRRSRNTKACRFVVAITGRRTQQRSTCGRTFCVDGDIYLNESDEAGQCKSQDTATVHCRRSQDCDSQRHDLSVLSGNIIHELAYHVVWRCTGLMLANTGLVDHAGALRHAKHTTAYSTLPQPICIPWRAMMQDACNQR